MATRASDNGREIGTFLGLTFGLSAILWALIISAGSLGVHGGAYVFALMWCPGVSALVTRLIYQRNVRGEGWGLGQPRWLALAYVLPIVYATVVYGLVWLSGLGAVDLSRFKTPVVTFVVLGSLQSLLSATGEELGWRGYLVPALARTKSFKVTALISGATWAGWHFPLIIGADYNGGTPPWYSVLCFAVMVVAMGFPVRVAAPAIGQCVAGGDSPRVAQPVRSGVLRSRDGGHRSDEVADGRVRRGSRARVHRGRVDLLARARGTRGS
jgi:membrane protease YdiL (CAAX protease family)